MDTLNRDDVERLYKPYWADGGEPYFECGEGWFSILADLAQKLGTLDEFVQVLQIKEKFGGLRVYVATESPQVEELIRAAELAAGSTCEVCGNPGVLGAKNYWWSTRCDADKPEGWVAAADDEDDEAV